jgi:phenylpropionate dioxygenase-like ring-hydroxylating dioxygenase large terminal subunit
MNDYSSVKASKPDATFTEAEGLLTGPVPMEPYRSQDYYDLEIEMIFRRAWLLVGRVEELPVADSYVVKEVECCHASVLITRQKSGTVHAFHNVCSHRGNQVALNDRGTASRLVCRYHNWTFGNDGRLIGVPDEASFFDLDKKKCGLTPIAAEVWEGFIFINLSPTPEVTLKEFLGEFGEHFAGMTYVAADHPITFSAELKCNWKVVADAFCEAYHIPAIHPKTIGSTFASGDDPFSHLLYARIFGPHRMNSMPGNPKYQPKPTSYVELMGQELAASPTAISSFDPAKLEDFLAHRAVNPTKHANWGMDINSLFPHVQIGTGYSGFFIQWFWPLSVNRTRHEARFYMPRPGNAIERFRMEEHISRMCEVMLEDLNNVERTQKGLESKAKDYMQLQDNEISIRHQIEQVEKWVRSSTVREALN